MTKRIMRQLAIGEISAVDMPAQTGAKAMIVKRAEGEPIVKVDIDLVAKRYISPMDGAVSFGTVLREEIKCQQYYQMTAEVDPLICSLNTSLYSIAGDSSYDDATKLTMARSTVEDFMTTLRSKWADADTFMMAALAKVETKEKEMDELAKLKAQVAELTAKLKEAEEGGKAAKAAEKELAAVKTQLEKAQAQVAELTTKSVFNDSERAYFDTLEKSEQADFLKMSKRDRAAAVKKGLEDDETLTVKGKVIRKSKVGEDMFEILKGQQEEALTLAKGLDDEREKRVSSELAAKAKSEYGHLPGTDVEKAAVLKAMEDMDAPVRDTLTKMLVAGDGALKAAFNTVGHGRGDISQVTGLRKAAGQHPFLVKVAEIKKRDGVGQHQAMTKARNEYPDEFADYNKKDGN